MTDQNYEPDVFGDDDGDSLSDETPGHDAGISSERTREERTDDHDRTTEQSPPTSESVGITIPDEHVGAFVAQAFEDPERDTDWEGVIDAVIAPDARDAWDGLSPTEQAVEILAMADDYDKQSIALLEEIPTDQSTPTEQSDHLFTEAMRCRRNADRFRDGIAAAYATDHLSADDLVNAVEKYGFDTNTIAAREDRVEAIAEIYDYDFRPYGGTLMDTDTERDESTAASEAW